MMQFPISIFLSAFLLFLVQPLVGRLILPWFGGTSSVWSCVLMIFQILLLFGYLYANSLISKFNAIQRKRIHLFLIAFALSSLVLAICTSGAPLIPHTSFKPIDSNYPLLKIVIILLCFVGPCYLLLASNTSLTQYWFSQKSLKNPYPLYACSNFGSVLALLAYPFILEPFFSLKTQVWIWFGLFCVFAVFCTLITLSVNKGTDENCASTSAAPPALGISLVWVFLSAIPTLGLMAVTAKITSQIAPVPFLWIVPLLLYLASFIITFSDTSLYKPRFNIILALLATLIYWALELNPSIQMPIQVTGYFFVHFIFCLILHSALYSLKPDKKFLANFYVKLALGGAIGGSFVALFAPMLFNNYYETGIFLCLSWLGIIFAYLGFGQTGHEWKHRHAKISVYVFAGCTICQLVIFLAPQQNLLVERNFYGVIKVSDLHNPELNNSAIVFFDGGTLHGLQYKYPPERQLPTAYFSHQSGIGIAINQHKNTLSGLPRRIGIIGAGIGGLVSYAKIEDYLRLYEINPKVIELSLGLHGYFSYISDSSAKIDLIDGDARLALEREFAISGSHNFDILVMDAFSSTSVPTHLLTREAFEIYNSHLRDQNALLAINITNKYVDLRPVVVNLARFFGKSHVHIKQTKFNSFTTPSDWMLLSADKDYLDRISQQAKQHALIVPSDDIPNQRIWNDDYSSILGLVKLF